MNYWKYLLAFGAGVAAGHWLLARRLDSMKAMIAAGNQNNAQGFADLQKALAETRGALARDIQSGFACLEPVRS